MKDLEGYGEVGTLCYMDGCVMCGGDLYYGESESENCLQWIYCKNCGWDCIK